MACAAYHTVGAHARAGSCNQEAASYQTGTVGVLPAPGIQLQVGAVQQAIQGIVAWCWLQLPFSDGRARACPPLRCTCLP